MDSDTSGAKFKANDSNMQASGMDSSTNEALIAANGGKRRVYVQYSYRWVIWVWFMLQKIAFGIAMVGYSAISPVIRDVYGITDLESSFMVLWFTVLYIPVNFPANHIIENYGISLPIRIGAITIVAGSALRLLLHDGFYLIVAGQWIIAIGLPFCHTLGVKIAAVWFGDKQRATATTVSSIAIILGTVIGFVFPTIFVTDSDKDDHEEAKNKLWKYTLVQSITLTVLTLPVFFLVRNKPETPPSRSARKALKQNQGRILPALKGLLSNPNYWLIMVPYALIFSMHTILGASVGAISDAFGYDTKGNSAFGSIFVITGFFGSIVNAIFLDRFRKYKVQLVLITLIGMASIGFCAAVIDLQHVWLTWIGLAIMGISWISMLGHAYSFWAELTFPIGESISCGFMQAVSSVYGSIMTVLVNVGISKYGGYATFVILGANTTIGFLASIFIKEILKKTGHQHQISMSYLGSIAVVPIEDPKDDEDEDSPSDQKGMINKLFELFECILNTIKYLSFIVTSQDTEQKELLKKKQNYEEKTGDFPVMNIAKSE